MTIKDKWENAKARFIIFLMKLLFKSDKREFVIKWTELKLKIIEKDVFDKWVTRQILGE